VTRGDDRQRHALVVDTSVWIAAYQRHERRHAEGLAFLATVARLGQPILVPTLVQLEYQCGIARRSGEPLARQAVSVLLAHPTAVTLPIGPAQFTRAANLGMRYQLRTLDACLVAVAAEADAELVSWDEELLTRAGARTPAEWLGARGVTA
jgi:predicted nucleic acid-binding protein